MIRNGGAPRVAIFCWFFGSPLLAVSCLFFSRSPFTDHRSPITDHEQRMLL